MVSYACADPVNAFDARMRKGNVADAVTHHVGVELAGRMQVELLKPGQTMKDLPPELWHESYKRRANRRVSDGTPTENEAVRRQASSVCMEICRASRLLGPPLVNLSILPSTAL